MMKIAFLGDIALIGKYDASVHGIENVMARFQNIIPILKECDYVVGNMETAITNKRKSFEFKTLSLKTNPDNLEILVRLGVDIVSLANNHVFDYGIDAVNEAKRFLEGLNIKYIGLDDEGIFLHDDSACVYINGLCCYSTNAWHYKREHTDLGINVVSKRNLNRQIDIAKKKKALPVLITHWGDESTHYPRYEHIRLSKDVLSKERAYIVGHHPHVIQGIQKFDRGEVAYSLGNFCFDDCESKKYAVSVKQTEENKKGYIYILEVLNEKVTTHYIPYYDDGEKIVIMDKLKEEIDGYSAEINMIYNREAYEFQRYQEKKNIDGVRLGKRNFKWLLHHLNINSIGAVWQRKINQKRFNEIIIDIDEDNKMKNDCILYIGNFDQCNRSAAGKRVYGNKLLLNNCGYNVKLVGKNVTNAKSIEDEDFLYFPNYSTYCYKKYVRWLENYIKSRNINPICIIRYGSPSIALFDLELSKYCTRKDIPLVVDAVDWLNVDGGSILFKFVKKIDTWLEKAVLNKRADGIIVISKYLSNIYKAHSKTIIIPPLIEKTKENISTNEILKLVYAGCPFRKGIKINNIHSIKDRLDLVVETICEIEKKSNVKLDIYGLTKEEYLVAFPDHKSILEKDDSIRFYGTKPMAYVQNEISKADFTILLRERNRSTMAGFPTKIVESISLGTPVITTDTSDLKDYIENGKQGFFVDICNKDSLIEAMTEICNMDRSQIYEMKLECKRLGIRFLPQSFVTAMNSFLKCILERRNV